MVAYLFASSSGCRPGVTLTREARPATLTPTCPTIREFLPLALLQHRRQHSVYAAMESMVMSAEITSKNALTNKVVNQVEPDRFLLHMQPVIKLTNDQLFELCQINQELWIERTAEGDLVIVAPEGWETRIRNANLVTLLTQWAWQDGTGTTTGSTAGYILPNGAMRAPDVA